MKQLIIRGGASKKEIILPVSPLFMRDNLLNFLRDHEIPVASSCGGDGICQKCVCLIKEEKILTCMTSVSEVLNGEDSATLSISYL